MTVGDLVQVQIVDAFLANDEHDLVEFRIELLDRYVDRFVIGESRQTFSGRQKPLHFKPRYANHKKIQVIELPKIHDATSRWDVEEAHRNLFLTEICQGHDRDLILFCDVDEIPHHSQVLECIERVGGGELDIISLWMPTYLRRANWGVIGSGAKWAKAKAFLAFNSQPNVRYMMAPATRSRGHHFSYLGTNSDSLKSKYSSFSHAELDYPALSSPDLIKVCDMYGLIHFGGFFNGGSGLLRHIDVEHLDDVQRQVLNFKPDWIAENPFQTSLVSRLRASKVVSELITDHNRDLASISAPKGPLCELIVLLQSSWFGVLKPKWMSLVSWLAVKRDSLLLQIKKL